MRAQYVQDHRVHLQGGGGGRADKRRCWEIQGGKKVKHESKKMEVRGNRGDEKMGEGMRGGDNGNEEEGGQ